MASSENPFVEISRKYTSGSQSSPSSSNPFVDISRKHVGAPKTAGASVSAVSNAAGLYKRLTEEGQTEQQKKKKGFNLGLGLKSVGKSTLATVPVLAETAHQAIKNDLAAPEARAQLADIVTPAQMRSGNAMDYSNDAEYARLLKAADDAEAERDALYSALGVRKILGGTFAKSGLTGEQYQQLKAADQKVTDAKTAFSRYNYEAQKAQSDAKLSEDAKNAMEEIEAAQKPVDPNRLGMKLMRSANEDWERATEGLDDNQKFWANVGRSIVENAAVLPAAMVSPVLPAVIMGAKSAAGKTFELSEQGVPADQAMVRGIAAGAIEVATEKVPIGNLMETFRSFPGGVDGFVTAVLKQAGTEATEEMVSYVANYLVDVVASDPNATFSIEELMGSAVAGAVSGGVFGAGTAGVSAIANRSARAPKSAPVAQLTARQENMQAEAQNATQNVATAEREIETATTPQNSPVSRLAETQENMQGESQAQPQNVATAEPAAVAVQEQIVEEPAAKMQQEQPFNVTVPDTVKASKKKNARRVFFKNIAETFNLPTTPRGYISTEAANNLGPSLDTLLAEYEATGEISDGNVRWFMDKLVDQGIVREDAYGLYDLKRELETTRVTVPQANKNDVSEGWATFLKRNRGNLNIVNNGGIPVDAKYMELSDRYPNLFPDSITDPAGQIMQMSKVAKEISITETPLADYIGDGEDFARSAMPKLKSELQNLVRDYYAETPDMFGFSDRSEEDAPPDVPANEYGYPLYDPLPPSDTVAKDYTDDSMEETISQTDGKRGTMDLLEKLTNAIPSLKDMQAVFSMTGTEFQKGEKKLTEQVGDFFKSIGNLVHRSGFGDVTLNERGVRTDMAHGIGRAKAVTFAAIPDVIKKGKQIDFEENWKGRGYDSYVFAAPVTIAEGRGYVAAVVIKDRGKNRFYLHEVLDENGKIIYLDTQKGSEPLKNGVTAQGGITVGSKPFNPRIAEPAQEVKSDDALRIVSPEYMQAMAENKTLWRKFYSNFVSGTEALERIQQENYGINLADDVQAVRDVGGVVDFIAEKGLVDRNGNIIGKSWKQLVEQIPKGEDNILQEYWENLHNIDRLARGLPVLDATAEESRARANEIARNHPWVVAQKAEMQEWYNTFMREHVVASGLMSAEAYAELQAMYPNYMPTYREWYDRSMASSYSRGRSHNVSNPIRRAVGSTEQVRSLEDTFMENINRLLRTERKNDLMQRLYQFAEQHPETAAMYARTVPTTQALQNAYENGLDEAGAFTDAADALSLQEVRRGVYQVNLRVDGHPVSMQVSGDVFKALDNLFNSRLDIASSAAKRLSNIPKSLITGYNTFFAITNAIRDVQTGYINSITDRKTFLGYLADIGKAGKEIFSNSADWQLYRANGGSRSGWYNNESGFRKSLRGQSFDGLPPALRGSAKVLNNVVGGIGKVASAPGSFTENVVRFAEFKKSLQQNGRSRDDIRRAMSAAADVTVNFGRNAPITKTADAWVLYLNAGVQGLDKTARQFVSNPSQTLRRGAELVIPAAILFLLNSGNPNYDELEDGIKDNYYIIPNVFDRDENGFPKTFIRLPKSREWGAILSGTLERIAGMVMEGETFEEAFDGFGKTLENNYGLSNPVTENFLGTFFIDLPQNKTWAGGSIVPEYMQGNRSPKYQYDYTTSAPAKAIGERFNVSPMKVDYALDQTTGILWDLVKPMTNEANNNFFDVIGAPLKSKFVADPLYSSKTVDAFYDLKEETAMAAGDFEIENGTPEGVTNPEKALSLYLDEKGREMSDLLKQEKAAEAAGGKNKTQTMKDLRKQRNQTAKEAIETAEEYRNVYSEYYNKLMSQMESEVARLPEEKRAKAYSYMSTYAKESTREDVLGEEPSAWVETVNESNNPYALAAEYAAAKAAMSGSTKKADKIQALVDAGWTRSRAETLYKTLG